MMYLAHAAVELSRDQQSLEAGEVSELSSSDFAQDFDRTRNGEIPRFTEKSDFFFHNLFRCRPWPT